MQRLIIPIGAFALMLLIWVFLAGTDSGSSGSHELEAKSTQPPPFQGLPSGSTAARTDARVPPPDEQYKPLWTLERVARSGILGRATRWIEPIMSNPFWKAMPDGDGRVYKNQNGVVLTFVSQGAHVRGIEARFPKTAMSADLTALSEYIIGNQSHLPMHLEAHKRPGDTPLFGDFEGADGRRYYYRATLRNTGDPPFGPEFFAVSTAPFEGQPVQLDLHPDEHVSPRQPVPLDAGAP